MPPIQGSNLVVEWCPGVPVEPDEYDKDYEPPANAPEDDKFLSEDYDSESTHTDDDDSTGTDDGPESGSEDEYFDDTQDLDDSTLEEAGANATDEDETGTDVDEADMDDGGAVATEAEGNTDEAGATVNDAEVDVDDAEADNSVAGDPDEAPVDETGASIDGAGADPDEEEDFLEPSSGNEADIDDPADTMMEDASIPNNDEEIVAETVEEDEDEQSGDEVHSRPYNLRGNREWSYDHRFDRQMDNPSSSSSYDPQSYAQYAIPSDDMDPETAEALRSDADLNQTLFNFIFTQLLESEDAHEDGQVFTQMSASKGIRKHGQAAKDVMRGEVVQLDNKDVLRPFDGTNLSEPQKRQVLRDALRAVNLIKEKRDGTLKGRTCADGRPQRGMFDKSETTSPTISTEALFLSLMIDAKEGRDVATADVAGAYLNADMPDYVLLRIEGDMIDIVCEVNPTLKSGIIFDDNGKRVLIVVVNKALYGLVKSSVLWYDLFVSVLKGMGFTLNAADLCVANAIINGKQCTICWYVDDNKISHIEVKVVDNIIAKIESHFGKMKVTRGDEHVFLGMNIHFPGDGTVQIGMQDYLTEAIAESKLDIRREAATPAKNHSFMANEDSPKLSATEAARFVSTVYKLAYVGLRGRSDLRTALGFLMTRVHEPSREDQSKLKRLLEYIKGSLDLTVTLGADDLTKFYVWVDVAFATHNDRKSHTGGAISFGRGAIMCMSNKQKLVTRSTTESEFVGASDYLPNPIWVKMFMKGQGYEVKEVLFDQDNESTIKLLTNGRKSAGKQSRHIDVRYWWTKDRLESEGITVRYCHTLAMLADFLSKPLQGRLFRKFRSVLLGYAHISTLADDLPRVSEERVGNQNDDKKDSARESMSWIKALVGSGNRGQRMSNAHSVETTNV